MLLGHLKHHHIQPMVFSINIVQFHSVCNNRKDVANGYFSKKSKYFYNAKNRSHAKFFLAKTLSFSCYFKIRKRDKILTKKRKINQEDDDEFEVNVERIEDIADEWMVLSEDEEEKETIQRKRRKYQNILMLSEWMVDVPNDLTSNWFVSICPIAKRCSVIASQGKTRVFARNGYEFMQAFQSALPSGNKLNSSSSHCALDCLYEGRSKTFYILDPLIWNGVSFYGTDTPFRDYWLTSRITEELSHLCQVNNYNRYSMKILPRIKCNVEYLVQVINQVQERTSSCTQCGRKEENPMQDQEENKSSPKKNTKNQKRTTCNCSIDGLLFVHEMALYAPGVNPLANWIKPHMCEQLLTQLTATGQQ